MRIWDSLFVIFVLGPLVTGGVWLKKKGLHLEYTEAGIGALVLAAVAYRWHRQGRSLADSQVLRLGQALWRRWRALLAENPRRALVPAWLFFALGMFLTSVARHRAFGSGLADLGIFTNAIANVIPAGFPFSSLKGATSLLADHQDFLVYPLGWIFPLWPSPYFLLLLQALGLTAGGLALYFLARQRVGAEHPLLPWLPFAYWLAGPLRSAGRFDFHPEVFLLPLFLFAVWLLQEKTARRRLLGALLFLVALAGKESAGPVACGIGLAWLLGAGPTQTRRFTRLCGIAAIALGLGVFYVDSRMIPSMLGKTYSYADLYEPFGSTPLALALAPFTHPLAFATRLLGPLRLKFLAGSLLPWAFLPVLAPLSLLAALPGYLMLFLSSGGIRVSLGFHYAIEPTVGLLFALPAALESGFVAKHARTMLVVFLLASLLSYGRSGPYYWRSFAATPHQQWARKEALPKIARERSVAASYALVPHLAARRWVNEIRELNGEQGKPVDCAVWDSTVNNTPMSPEEIAALPAKLAHAGFTKELDCGSFQVFRHAGAPSCLSEPVRCEEGL